MIEYIIPHNPDDRILKRAGTLLKEGKIICFPTDTNWLLVCDVFSPKAVESLYKVKGEELDHHFSVLCTGISEASQIALIHNNGFRWLNKMTPGPYTFIFEANKKIVKAVKASHRDHEVGIRIPDCPIVAALARSFPCTLLSTNITPSMVGLSAEQDHHDIYSVLIEQELGTAISMILDPGEVSFLGPSTVIDFREENQPVLIRQGAGGLPFAIKHLDNK